MSDLKKGIWFPLFLLVLILAIALWFPFKYGEAFILTHRLLNEGTVENALIVRKGVLVDSHFVLARLTQPSQDHQFQVRFSGMTDRDICQIRVSKSLFDATPLGGRIPVTFLPKDPKQCRLSSGLKNIYRILLVAMGISSSMLVFVAGSSYFIRRAYRRAGPGSSDELTSRIRTEKDVICPECSAVMTEGYLPMGFGINWRKISQPVGIPTVFSGLPGTVFWLRRPKLHAYHCDSCRIVIFKYGKMSS